MSSSVEELLPKLINPLAVVSELPGLGTSMTMKILETFLLPPC